MILAIDTDSGLNVYAVVRDSNDNPANGTSTESFNAAHWASLYAIIAPEQSGTGRYQITAPTYLAAGNYSVTFYIRGGAIAAIGDSPVGAHNFTISAVASVPATPSSTNTDSYYQTQLANIDTAIANLIANPRPNYSVGSVKYDIGDYLKILYDTRERILKAWKAVPADGWETTQQDINPFGQDLDAYLNENQ